MAVGCWCDQGIGAGIARAVVPESLGVLRRLVYMFEALNSSFNSGMPLHNGWCLDTEQCYLLPWYVVTVTLGLSREQLRIGDPCVRC